MSCLVEQKSALEAFFRRVGVDINGVALNVRITDGGFCAVKYDIHTRSSGNTGKGQRFRLCNTVRLRLSDRHTDCLLVRL